MKTERTYVKVTSDFDSTGYMQPRTITWKDGRTFHIDAVKDLRPASMFGRSGDCYTIVIKGEERHLFFERSTEFQPNRFGRWFVESAG
ncbi:MAG: hypothetical protein IJV40_15880 [Oscillospiraceae bacterium]|nr:hypothetical protein [Oscillospiraceae bacterium]